MVPALNEEDNIEQTITGIISGLRNRLSQYEILIFNDGSQDATGKICDSLEKSNKQIRVFHHQKNKGMGYCYKKGLEFARFNYYMYIPGDNQFPKEALIKLISMIGKADIVVPFVTNMYIRPPGRRFLSKLFTDILNLIFQLNIPYYNGTVIHRKKLLLKAIPQTNGFAYQAESLIKLVKSGATFVGVGYEMVERKAGSTSAFKIKNIKSVFKSIITLFWQIQILGIENKLVTKRSEKI